MDLTIVCEGAILSKQMGMNISSYESSLLLGEKEGMPSCATAACHEAAHPTT